MTGRILIDTSAWVEALRTGGDPATREVVHRALASGAATLCDMVRLELWNGAGGNAERRILRELDSELECLPTTVEVWRCAVELAIACRTRGLTVPATDLLIFACARGHGLELLHHDKHFDQLGQAFAAR